MTRLIVGGMGDKVVRKFNEQAGRRGVSMGKEGFTVLELLVVIAIISVIVAMVLPMLLDPEGSRLVRCMNNLRQISLGLLMYAGDSSDKAPGIPGTADSPGLNWTGYKTVMKDYLGLKGPSSQHDPMFACPLDTFHYDFTTNFGSYVPKPLHEQAPDYLSYAFNGGNARTNSNAPGIAGRSLASIKDPSRTVLLMEAPALFPYSWHQPKRPFTPQNAIFNDARNMVSFVDGHVSYIKIYWGGNNPPGSLALHQDPPPGYDYKWNGD